MRQQHRVIEQWLALSNSELTDRVRTTVRNSASQSREVWEAVSTHPVLVARVRGILSIVQAQIVGSRDEAVWTAWISQARAQLATPAKIAEEPVKVPVKVPATAPRTPPVEPPMIITAQPAAERRAAPAVAPLIFRAPGQ